MVVLIRNYSTLLLTLATARGLHSPLLIFLSPLALGSVWKLITLLCAVAKPGLRLWGHVHPLLYNNSKFYNVEKQSFVSSYGNKKLVHPLLYNNSKFYNVEKQSFVSSYGNKKLVHP